MEGAGASLGMHSLDPDGNDRAVESDTPLDQTSEVPLRPACTPRDKATAVQEDDHRQWLGSHAPGVERRR